jgi:hypothetical protein
VRSGSALHAQEMNTESGLGKYASPTESWQVARKPGRGILAWKHVSDGELLQPERISYVKQLLFVFNFCFALLSVAIGHTAIDLMILPENRSASEVQYGSVL